MCVILLLLLQVGPQMTGPFMAQCSAFVSRNSTSSWSLEQPGPSKVMVQYDGAVALCGDTVLYSMITLLRSVVLGVACVWLWQPFTERSLQVVEAVSVFSEILIFLFALGLAANPSTSADTAGSVAAAMILFASIAFFFQVFNQ